MTFTGRDHDPDATTYKVVRFFADDEVPAQVVAVRLSLDEAQSHCKNPQSSSATADGKTARERTAKFGAWFDGYEEEK